MGSSFIRISSCPHGQGIYAVKNFKKGDVLFQFEGKRVSEPEIIDPGQEGYYLQIGVDEYLDTTGFGRFTCHSCEPNSGLKDDVTIIAIQDIKEGTEIVFDYSTCMLENNWTLNCHCGAPTCRKVIRDFDQIPKELQERYRKLKVVPQWLLDAISSK